MLTDLTCPAEIFRTLMPTEDIPAVTLTLYNLCDRVIASVEVTVRMLSAAGAEKERMTFRGRALNGRPHSTFQMNVPMAPAAGVRSADVVIDKVWFADKDVWRRDEENLTEYTPNDLPPSNALTRLRYAAGETAAGYPDQQDGLWVCVCGRPNPDLFSVCARCRREKAMVFTMYNREAVENQIALRERQLDLSTRSAREDTARLQRIREEEYHQKENLRRRRLRLAGALALCLVIVAVMLGALLPTLRMITAGQAMAAGDYAGALETLNDLSAYPGARARIRECNWQIAARESESSRDPEVLAAAAAVLREDAEREGSAEAADQADLKRARMILAEGDLDGARAAVAALPEDSEGRIALENDCKYLEACNLLDAREYTAAREIFLSLGSYPNASDMAAECLYRTATNAFSAQRYEEAISLFSQIPDYADSRRMTLLSHYTIATALEMEARSLADPESGKLSGPEAEALISQAASEYLLAGDWDDAQDKTQEMNYMLADAAFEREDYPEAQRLFASIPGYLDADEQVTRCVYMQAYDVFLSGDYAYAYELFSAMPQDYGDVAELRIQSAYEAGYAFLLQKDYDKATAFFTIAGDYMDAPKQLAAIQKELDEEAKQAEKEALQAEKEAREKEEKEKKEAEKQQKEAEKQQKEAEKETKVTESGPAQQPAQKETKDSGEKTAAPAPSSAEPYDLSEYTVIPEDDD